MKRVPQTAQAYAQHLYMASKCTHALCSITDAEIINSRVRAFVDGVNWQKRQAAKKRRANNGRAEQS